MQQDPRIDRHRGAVYQAEDVIASVMGSGSRRVRVGREVLTLPPEVHFGELGAIQAFVDAVLAEPATAGAYPGVGPVRVVPRRGYRRATYAAGTIHIPVADRRGRWAMDRGVVLHELAHHLAGEPGHGAAFQAALLHLTELQVGASAARLLGSLFAPLASLPDPERVPSEGIDDDQVRRVAALLAKAEATASVEEAEAYLAKAALVAQRHSIDLAVASLVGGARQAELPTHRMLTIGEPRRALNKLLVSLYLAIARAWSVKVDIGSGSTYVIGYGMPGDLDQVESVFATASAMMLGRAHAHVQGRTWQGSTYRPAGRGPTRPVTAAVARNAFCVGFIERTGERMAEAAGRARSEASAGGQQGGRPGGAPGRRQVALALRARDLAVNDYHRTTTRARGAWRGSASAAGAASGSRHAGRRAADELGRGAVADGRLGRRGIGA
ncbi:MAG TPA: TIGR04338 family metallohydrolase [Candidatus Nanopelagicales bacterium]